MNEKDYFQIGYISKIKGLKGELQLFIEADYPEEYKNLESVFLEINLKPVPFFISKLSLQKNIAYIYLEDIDHIDKAQPLLHKKVYILLKDIPEATQKFGFKDFKGFSVNDEQIGDLGIIKEVQEMPSQWMAYLDYKNKEVLFPLNEQFIKAVDQKNKRINVDLPDGLLDIYLSA